MSIAEPMSLSLAVNRPATAEAEHSVLSFESVYRQYFASVWRTLRRLGVIEAQLDDATQDVFLVVHRRLHEFDARGGPRSWLYAIAIRVASDYRRRATRQHTEPLPELADPGANPVRHSALRESVALLHELLGQLDESKRAVFVLAELEQLSVPEISEALALNQNTVYARLRAARLRFEAALTRHRARTMEGRRR